jgi:hypothetical protein
MRLDQLWSRCKLTYVPTDAPLLKWLITALRTPAWPLPVVATVAGAGAGVDDTDTDLETEKPAPLFAAQHKSCEYRRHDIG